MKKISSKHEWQWNHIIKNNIVEIQLLMNLIQDMAICIKNKQTNKQTNKQNNTTHQNDDLANFILNVN